MMKLKRLKTINRAKVPIVVLCAALFTLRAMAWDVKVNGIAYTVHNSGDNAYASVVYDALHNDLTELKIVPEVTFNGTTYPVTEISESSFRGCTNAQSVIIPEGIEVIGYRSFEDCTGLESISLPNSLKLIKNYAFNNCTSLSELTIPRNVTELGDIYGCSNLKTLYINAKRLTSGSAPGGGNLEKLVFGDGVEVIPSGFCDGFYNLSTIIFSNTIREIGNYAFTDTKWLKSQSEGIVYAGKVALCVKGTVPDEVTIKSGTLGIADCFLEKKTNVTKVVIPTSCTHIGSSAFKGCTGLTCDIPIHDKMLYIGAGAFSGCAGLTGTLSIPSGLTTIEEAVFEGCSGLTGSITIPASVTTIGEYAFSGCAGLSGGTLTIPAGITSIGLNAFFGCAFTALYYDAEQCKCAGAFGTDITTLTFGEHVRTIPRGFGGLKIRSVVVPEWIEKVEASALNSDYLQSVNWNAINCKVLGAPFYGCENLTEFKFGDKVKTIGYGLLSSLKHLSSVDIPNSVDTIYQYAFAGCTGLTSITIPSNLKVIDGKAFEDCTSLTTVYWNAKKTEVYTLYTEIGYLFFPVFPESVKTIIFGDDVESIPRLGCEGLAGTLRIPDKVKTIGSYSFRNNKDLEEVILGSSVEFIGREAFEGCTALKSITIPESVTSITAKAFDGCTNMTTVYFNAKNCYVNSIYDSFGHEILGGPFPSALKNVVFGNKVEYIPSYLFYYCQNLTEVNIPSKVWCIDAAFIGCSSIQKVTLGKAVNTISGAAFAGCSGLESIDCYATRPPGCSNDKVFSEVNCSLVNLNVPSKSIEQYKQTSPWSGFKIGELSGDYDGKEITSDKWALSILSMEEHTAALTGVVDGEQLAENLVIPSTVEYNGITFAVTEIEDDAFYNNRTIKSVVIPGSVERIGHRAFQYTGLSSITLNEGLKEIGFYAFEGTNVTEFILPASVEKIENMGCVSYALKRFVVKPGSKHFTTVDDVLFDKEVKRLVGYPYLKATEHYVTPVTCESLKSTFIWSANLKSFTLGENVKEFGNFAFWTCRHPNMIYVDGGNEHFKSVDGVLFSKDGTQLYFYPNKEEKFYRVPDGVTTILYGAFYGSYPVLEDLVLPATVTKIETSQGFSGIKTDFTIHSGMTSLFDLPDYVFCNRENKYNLKVPKGMLATYRAHPVWGLFKSIEEEETLGVEDISSDKPQFAINGTSVTVAGGSDVRVEIFDMAGRVIYVGTPATIALPHRGIYVLRVNGVATKINV